MQGGFSSYGPISINHLINRINEKNQGIISVETRNTFGNTQYPLKIKVLSKLEIGGNFLNLRRASKKKNMPNIFNSEVMNPFLLRSGTR